MVDSYLNGVQKHYITSKICTHVWITVFLAPRIKMVFEVKFIKDHIHL